MIEKSIWCLFNKETERYVSDNQGYLLIFLKKDDVLPFSKSRLGYELSEDKYEAKEIKCERKNEGKNRWVINHMKKGYALVNKESDGFVFVDGACPVFEKPSIVIKWYNEKFEDGVITEKKYEIKEINCQNFKMEYGNTN